MKKIIQPTVIILLVIVALLFVTGNGFVFQMVSKVLETGRTTAGIDDYLFFDNIEIPEQRCSIFIGCLFLGQDQVG